MGRSTALYRDLILRGIFYVLAVIALSMAALFPVLCLLLPAAVILRLLSLSFHSQIQSGYLFQIRSVCKLE